MSQLALYSDTHNIIYSKNISVEEMAFKNLSRMQTALRKFLLSGMEVFHFSRRFFLSVLVKIKELSEIYI